ncbi:MAG: Slp family lipoprotein [Leptospirillum sp.]
MIKTIKTMGEFLSFLILLTLTACADSPPFSSDQIDRADKSVTLSRLMDSPDDYTGKTVIVGGVINVVERQGILNRIYVQAYPMDSAYHPDLAQHSAGHIMVVTDQPLSPALFAPGRTIEVLGTVHKTQVMPNFADRAERVVVIKARVLHVRRRPLPPPRGIGFGYMPMMGF